MALRNIKLLIGVSILLAYISIGIFGLFKFEHKAEMPMDNCPYAQNSYSVCENNFDHISNWRQFSNVITLSFFIFSIIILGLILYLFYKQNFLHKEQYFYRWQYGLYSKKLEKSPNRIIKWLSLLENSPAFS